MDNPDLVKRTNLGRLCALHIGVPFYVWLAQSVIAKQTREEILLLENDKARHGSNNPQLQKSFAVQFHNPFNYLFQ